MASTVCQLLQFLFQCKLIEMQFFIFIVRCGNSYVVSELLDTEQSYIQDLGHVVKVR